MTIRVVSSVSLSFPRHGIRLVLGENEFADVPAPVLERFKALQEVNYLRFVESFEGTAPGAPRALAAAGKKSQKKHKPARTLKPAD